MIRQSVVHEPHHTAVGKLEPTVFIVHPNAESRRELSDASRECGCRTESFETAEDFLAIYDRTRAGCLITGDSLPGISGLALLDRLRSGGNGLPVIVVTEDPDARLAVQVMQHGAMTMLPLGHYRRDLCDTILHAMQLDAQERVKLSEQRELQRRMSRLTPAEAEVLELMIAGKANKNIARHQAVSLRTVETRRQQVFQKMEADSLAELILLVVQARTGHSFGEKLFAAERSSVSRME